MNSRNGTLPNEEAVSGDAEPVEAVNTITYATLKIGVEQEAESIFATKIATGELAYADEKAEGKARSKAVTAVQRALAAFMGMNALEDWQAVGAELIGGGYEAALRTMAEAQFLTDGQVRAHKAKLNSTIRPVAIEAVTKKQDDADSSSKSPFAEALSSALTERGMTAADAGRALEDRGFTSGPPDGRVRDFAAGRRQPIEARSLEMVSVLEEILELRKGMLSELLPSGGRNFRSATPSPSLSLGRSESRKYSYFLEGVPEARIPEALDWVENTLFAPAKSLVDFEGGEMFDEDGKMNRAPYALALPGEKAGRRKKAGERLIEQIEEIVRHKTSHVTAHGEIRNEKWGEYAAEKGKGDLLRFVGSFAEMGVPARKVDLSVMVSPTALRRYVDFYKARRGAITATVTNTFQTIGMLVHPKTGFAMQRPDLFRPLATLDGVMTEEEVAKAQSDPLGWMKDVHDDIKQMIGEIIGSKKRNDGVLEVGRDPFAPLLPVLEVKNPGLVYNQIADEIRRRMPDRRAHPVAWALRQRDLFVFRYAYDTVWRQRNHREALLRFPGMEKRDARLLERRGVMEVGLEENGLIGVRAPVSAFKNANSSALRNHETDNVILLTKANGFVRDFHNYLEARKILLRGHPDPGTLFVKDMTNGRAKDPTMGATAFYQMWVNIIRRYGVKNPFNGRGSIEDLGVHGPHAVRDVWATTMLKMGGPGAVAAAAAALFDTVDMIQNHYARYLPADANAFARSLMHGFIYEDAA